MLSSAHELLTGSQGGKGERSEVIAQCMIQKYNSALCLRLYRSKFKLHDKLRL